MISPMIEVTGARVGAEISGGREARAVWSFSATIWRAR